MAFQTKFRSDTATNWSTTNPTLAQGEVGVDITNNIFKIGSGSTAWNSLATAPTGSPTQTIPFRSLGDGGDGNVVITSGVTTLVRDMYYNNLTISGTGQIYTNGYRVFVKGILDLTNAQAGAINFNGASGSDAVANLAGSTPTIPSSGSIGTGGQGTSGVNGTTLQGTTSTTPTAIAGNGGNTNSCGAGGTGYATYTFTITAGNTASVGAIYTDGTYNYIVTTALTGAATSLVTIGFAIPNPTGTLTFVSGTGTGPIIYSAVAASNSGGGAGVGATGTTFTFVRGWKINLIRGTVLTLGGQGGRGGASGGGDGTFIGGGGGAGGNGAGVLAVYANIILKSSSTAAGVIQSNGGNGGAGGTSGGYLGGGGGGSGGGGGWIYLAYNYLIGPQVTNFIQANGGAGGKGGNGVNTIKSNNINLTSAGGGGAGGYGGRITIYNMVNQTGSERVGDLSISVNPEVSTTSLSLATFPLNGGSGGPSGLCQVTL